MERLNRHNLPLPLPSSFHEGDARVLPLDENLYYHLKRVGLLTYQFCKFLALPDKQATLVALGGLFHDIGKIAVALEIKYKPGKLNDFELEKMRLHAIYGKMIALASPSLKSVAKIIGEHHEMWNGQGYPLELKGKNIHLGARIVSIADSYDTMINYRPYRRYLWTPQEATLEIQRCAGTQFDPYLVQAFVEFMNYVRTFKMVAN